ncbi:FkbM family methyltransferase [Brevundimonas sp. S30B]|uniref:FkbM family methyltransferase n=1 Tax=unclassified Brevundimonas TaxID=2622653 RepID=UPI001072B1B5|nr:MULTISPECIES: FkbM family methyltransferase [unclassified Brevundimonas]QBX38110.1 FkbM family methyltransferase [Brevundimonas sp. MF30-B]TFW02535.1 FkbM family methyltransferase [Brevundimonas sp. S30B]
MTTEIAGVPITFDLAQPHERRYAACAALDVKYPQRDIDAALYDHVLRPGDRVLDMGANIGLTALEALQRGAAHVTCLEPVPELSRRIPVDPRIEVIGAAVSDRVGWAQLSLSDLHNQGATLAQDVTELFPDLFTANRSTRVPTVPIDRLDGPYDVWKMDVEGAEVAALRGAVETLSKRPPRAVIAEVYDQHLSDVRDRLEPSHPLVRRAGLRLDTYALDLRPPETFDSHRYHPTSPMYLFERG